MKMLFYTKLVTALIVGSSSTSVSIFASKQINSSNIQDNIQENESYDPLDSYKSLVSYFNKRFNNVNIDELNHNFIDSSITSWGSQFYSQFLNNKQGELSLLKMTPKKEMILQTFSNTYINRSEHNQVTKTPEFSKTVIDSHTFSISVSERVATKASFKIPFIADVEMSFDLSSEQRWTNTITTEERLTYPSQELVISPQHSAEALYTIRQGTYFNEGVLHFAFNNLDDVIWIPMFSDDELDSGWNNTLGKYKIAQVFDYLINEKWADSNWLDLNFSKYSLFSVDKNNSKYYLNLPITWESQGSKIDVVVNEKSL